jgi:phosphatidylglycerophosphatase C
VIDAKTEKRRAKHMAIVPTVEVEELKDRVASLLKGDDERIIAFDADGTLWRDDVGTLTFDHALRERELSDEALPALVGVLREHGDESRVSDANEAAEAINRLFLRGKIHEKEMAELQVWAYAGHTERSVRSLAADALVRGERTAMRHLGIEELLKLGRDLGAAIWIVSASPRWVVEEAVQHLGVDRAQVIGGEAALGDGKLRAELASPLPYGPEKLHALRRQRPTGRLVAAFGDSSFDLDLLRAAELAVGIGPKKAMLEGLAEIPHGVHLTNPR